MQRWYDEVYEEKEENGKRKFTWDGPSDFEQWENANPKILFLLKEALGDFEPASPQRKKDIGNKPFLLNIARWKFAIKHMFEELNQIPFFDSFEKPHNLGELMDDIAVVEVKKVDEGKGASDLVEINKYAENDKEFLKEQIDIINPQIILCGYTVDNYYTIFGGYNPTTMKVIIEDSRCACLSHYNRLIINFYHPSTRSRARAKELFEILCRMIKDGNVFEKFDWYRK